MREPACTVTETVLDHGLRGVILSNPTVALTVLPEKGCDIYRLVHRASGLDLLWKSPQGLRAPTQGRLSSDSSAAWLEMYEGGWQEILPNGGDACTYQGVELNFHGESTTLPWQTEIHQEAGDEIAVTFRVRLYRSPFQIARRIRLNARQSAIFFEESVTNWGADPMPFMWGHHPAFGAPFLGTGARLNTSARTVLVEDSYDSPTNPFKPGTRTAWPYATAKDGTRIDLRNMPGPEDRRDSLLYLLDFEGVPWYSLTNPDLGVGVGMAWTPEAFRCLWLWQEIHATRGFPWYGQAYTVAVEPWSSYPGFGLNKVIETTQTHLTLAGGETLQAALTCVVFDASAGNYGPTGVALDGSLLNHPQA